MRITRSMVDKGKVSESDHFHFVAEAAALGLPAGWKPEPEIETDLGNGHPFCNPHHGPAGEIVYHQRLGCTMLSIRLRVSTPKLTPRQKHFYQRLLDGAVLTFRLGGSGRPMTWYADEDPIPYRVGKGLKNAGLIKFSGRKENGGTIEHWEVVK